VAVSWENNSSFSASFGESEEMILEYMAANYNAFNVTGPVDTIYLLMDG
jgi:hypothetical protein